MYTDILDLLFTRKQHFKPLKKATKVFVSVFTRCVRCTCYKRAVTLFTAADDQVLMLFSVVSDLQFNFTLCEDRISSALLCSRVRAGLG